MSPEKQRVAIATVCGWTKPTASSANGLMGRPPGKICSFEYLPDYLGDLNAMHEAEKGLTDEQWGRYQENLRTVVLGGIRLVSQWGKADIHATAAQRSEAFLRTLGLWQPTPTHPQ